MNYSIDQWVIFFFIYCFIGWIWECSYVSIRTKKLTNRGFMRGPVLPIYGFGAVLMVWVGLPLMAHPVIMFFVGLLCASTMEYFTGDIMQRLFKVRYWDYTGCLLNIKGHVCLKASLAWGTFTLLMNYFVHKPIERLVLGVSDNVIHVIAFIGTILFVADYSVAFKTAMELRDVIISMEQFRKELDRMEKRLEVAIAFAEDSRQQAKDAFATKVEDNTAKAKLRMEERMDMLEKRIEEAREKLSAIDLAYEINSKKDELQENIEAKKLEFMQQMMEYKLRNAVMRTRLQESAKRRGVLYRHMIRNNPLVSDNFKEVLDEIKTRVNEHGKKGNE